MNCKKSFGKRRKRHTKRRHSKRRHSKRRFGYSHDQGLHLYNTYYSDGILMANDAFGSQWGNPEVRAENAGSG